jgi:hypothetical protein
MPNLEYLRSGPEPKAIIAALRCPHRNPFYRLAARMVKRALRCATRREAATALGMDERRLWEVLQAHPELEINRR